MTCEHCGFIAKKYKEIVCHHIISIAELKYGETKRKKQRNGEKKRKC